MYGCIGDSHFLFGFKFFRIKNTVHHSVGFDLQGNTPAIGSEIEIVGREIVRSERVVVSTVLQCQQIDLTLFETVRTLEEHVFEKVGFARLTKFFVSRSDAIPDHRGHDRGRVQFLCEDDQTVVQNSPAQVFSRKC